MNDQNVIPARLGEIIEDFQWSDGREKVEMLLEYAEKMPDLPEKYQNQQADMDLVEECMTPVYVQAEVEGKRMRFYFNVPAESPTVRGFASLLAEGLNDLTPEQVLQIPMDFHHQMGLQNVLTNQRLNGITAILAHMKQLALKYV